MAEAFPSRRLKEEESKESLEGVTIVRIPPTDLLRLVQVDGLDPLGSRLK